MVIPPLRLAVRAKKQLDSQVPWALAFRDRLYRKRSELGWVFIGQAVAFAGAFAGIKALTRTLGPQGYGELALGLSISGLLNTFIYGPISNTVTRYYSVYREQQKLSQYFRICRKTHVLAGMILLMAGTLAGISVALLRSHTWGVLTFFAILFGIAQGINSSFLALQSAIRQRKIVALHQAADAWLRPLLAVALMLVLGTFSPWALAGYLLGTTLVIFSQAWFAFQDRQVSTHWRAGLPSFPKDEAKELGGYTASFMVFSAFAAINLYSDRWLLQSFFGSRDVGIYVAIYQIASAPTQLLAGFINQLMVPIIYERAGAMSRQAQAQAGSRLLTKSAVLFTILMGLGTMIAWAAGAPIVRLFTTSAFAAAHSILWLLVLALSLFQIGQLLATKGLFYNRPRIYFVPKCLYAVSFLFLGWYGVPRYGLVGLAWAQVIAASVHLVFIQAANRTCQFDASGGADAR